MKDTVSKDRLRGIRIFDISDITHPRNVGNVQTCRGSHTHTVLVDPKDHGQRLRLHLRLGAGPLAERAARLRRARCPTQDPNSALFRIEVIKVPLAHPEQAAIVSSPRIFNDLAAPATHGEAPEDSARAQGRRARQRGAVHRRRCSGRRWCCPTEFIDDAARQRREGARRHRRADGGRQRGAARGASGHDRRRWSARPDRTGRPAPPSATTSRSIRRSGCAGGACEGYGLLLDIRDPAQPDAPRRRGRLELLLLALGDVQQRRHARCCSRDEWGGGGQPKCRATDQKEWGADAIFTLATGNDCTSRATTRCRPPQTTQENCVAHNGSLIPIPGRDVMVQAWYQGGISVFDWTDAAHPKEIAFFDRGPVDSTRMAMGGSWSVYWYNGVHRELRDRARARHLRAHAERASSRRTRSMRRSRVHLDYLNAQGQPKLVWPATFALARAYVDQLERSKGMDGGEIAQLRAALASAERSSGEQRSQALTALTARLNGDAGAGNRPGQGADAGRGGRGPGKDPELRKATAVTDKGAPEPPPQLDRLVQS